MGWEVHQGPIEAYPDVPLRKKTLRLRHGADVASVRGLRFVQL
jgi:hypothetical protein